MENKNNFIIFSIALIISSVILAFSFQNTFSKKGTVIVKGSSEKYVTADKVIWNISFVNAGNDLNLIKDKSIKDTEKVKNFFKKYNLTDEEIKIGQLEFVDMDSREYRDINQKNRFFLTQNLYVESNKINEVENASRNLLELIQENVFLKESYGSMKPIYIFTKLNEIKNSMIDEATSNAKKSADQFAKNSNTKIGKIKNANQGIFSITGRNKSDFENESYQKDKEVRVVSTFEYYLK